MRKDGKRKMDKGKIDDAFRQIEAMMFQAENMIEQSKRMKTELRGLELELASALRAELEH